MKIALPRLPYRYQALEPHISRTTLELHHGKHHRAYVEKARALAKEVRLADSSLEEVIRETAGKASERALFNNAAQAWNHAFLWQSMRPEGGKQPFGEIAGRIADTFGDYGTFAEKFTLAATSHFGSGWAWLVLDGDALRIVTTDNADTPLAHGQLPLFTLDLWEHAYYLDYQNRRPDYVAAFLGHLVNWDFANRNLRRPRAAARSLLDPLVEQARLSLGV
ncbi:MAG: superoxide dismutase [Kiloniellales bacterium]